MKLKFFNLFFFFKHRRIHTNFWKPPSKLARYFLNENIKFKSNKLICFFLNTDAFIPTSENLLVNLHECKEQIVEFLNDLPSVHQTPESPYDDADTYSSLGAAIKIAVEMMVCLFYLFYCFFLNNLRFHHPFQKVPLLKSLLRWWFVMLLLYKNVIFCFLYSSLRANLKTSVEMVTC